MSHKSNITNHIANFLFLPITVSVPVTLFLLALFLGPHKAGLGMFCGVGVCLGVLYLTFSRTKRRNAQNAASQSRRWEQVIQNSAFMEIYIRNIDEIKELYGQDLLGKAIKQCVERIQLKVDGKVVLQAIKPGRYQLCVLTEGGFTAAFDEFSKAVRDTMQDLISIDDKTLLLEVEFQEISAYEGDETSKTQAKPPFDTKKKALTRKGWMRPMPEMT